MALDGGEMIVPFSRNGLHSTLSYLTLDISPISTVSNAGTQNTALRDIGFEAKGFFDHDHLLYRVSELGGQRDANGHNSMRTVGYLQYDFFNPEKGYRFPGAMLGKQRFWPWTGASTSRVRTAATQPTWRRPFPYLEAMKPPHSSSSFIRMAAPSSPPSLGQNDYLLRRILRAQRKGSAVLQI
jgi:hypothetical protein